MNYSITNHSKLYYGKYSSRLSLESKYVISISLPAEVAPRGAFTPQWRNIQTPMKFAFDNKRAKDNHPWINNILIDALANECSEVIDFYNSIKSTYGSKIVWTVDPSYVRRSDDVLAFAVKFKFYFEDNNQAEQVLRDITKEYPELFDYIEVSKFSDSADKLISRDPRTVVMKKLPWNKFDGKVWLNYSRLSKFDSDKRNQILTMLESYEQAGLLRCQPLLKKFLSGHQSYLWSDTYIYTCEKDIKSVLDLVLVNIISKYERIILENG